MLHNVGLLSNIVNYMSFEFICTFILYYKLGNIFSKAECKLFRFAEYAIFTELTQVTNL